jgi:putative ABC transport system ATP-binding protein
MIKIKNLYVTFDKDTALENPVLQDVNLTISPGEFVTVIGSNGAGKSTLLNALAGDIRINQGSIEINQENVTKQRTERRAHLISRVFQNPMSGTWADLSVEENLALASKRGEKLSLYKSYTRKTRQYFYDVLAHLDIGLENRLNTPVSSLSGGQRQALSLVMATLRPSCILLLDEHTAALDPKATQTILQLTERLVKEHQLTTLMITHNMSQALQMGTRTLLMHHGKIIRDMNNAERQQFSPVELLTLFDEVM